MAGSSAHPLSSLPQYKRFSLPRSDLFPQRDNFHESDSGFGSSIHNFVWSSADCVRSDGNLLLPSLPSLEQPLPQTLPFFASSKYFPWPFPSLPALQPHEIFMGQCALIVCPAAAPSSKPTQGQLHLPRKLRLGCLFVCPSPSSHLDLYALPISSLSFNLTK